MTRPPREPVYGNYARVHKTQRLRDVAYNKTMSRTARGQRRAHAHNAAHPSHDAVLEPIIVRSIKIRDPRATLALESDVNGRLFTSEKPSAGRRRLVVRLMRTHIILMMLYRQCITISWSPATGHFRLGRPWLANPSQYPSNTYDRTRGARA